MPNALESGLDSTSGSRSLRPAGRAEEGPAVAGQAGTGMSADVGRYHHIVICMDHSQFAERALLHAAAMAHIWDAQLTLLHVLEHHPGGGDRVPVDAFDWLVRRQEARRFLEDAAAHPRLEELTVHTELQEGRAAEQIRAWAVGNGVDLIVLSTHGESGDSRWSLAGNAHKLVEGVDTSILLVPSTVTSPEVGRSVEYARILLPLDGSSLAERAIPVAMRLAAAPGAELIVALSLDRPGMFHSSAPSAEEMEIEDRVRTYNERAAGEYLASKLAQLKAAGIPARSVLVRSGDPRDALMQVASRERADLIILSAHGASGRFKAACGNVASHFITHTSAPLLIVREPGEYEEMSRCSCDEDLRISHLAPQ